MLNLFRSILFPVIWLACYLCVPFINGLKLCAIPYCLYTFRWVMNKKYFGSAVCKKIVFTLQAKQRID